MLMPFLRAVIGAFILTSFATAAQLPKAVAVLEQNCLKCHNSSVRMGGLSLVSAADARKGGAHGPAVVPGKPDDSLLVRMISGEKPKMPMQAPQLSGPQVAEIRSWIEQGAPWPEALRKDSLWSLRPLRIDARMQSIDAFVLAGLKERKLTPSPGADKATLIRRLTYDLHGLPPTWEEIQAFVGDRSANA